MKALQLERVSLGYKELMSLWQVLLLQDVLCENVFPINIVVIVLMTQYQQEDHCATRVSAHLGLLTVLKL